MHTHSLPLEKTEEAIQLLAGEGSSEPAVHVSVHPSL
jgi:hypothetical protein